MVPIIPVLAGIAIGAKVISWLLDELSEEERKKQRKLQKEYNRILKNIHKSIKDVDSDFEQKGKKIAQDITNEMRKNQYRHDNNIRKLFISLIDVYLNNLNEIYKDKSDLKKELLNTIKYIKSDTAATTHVRRNSLEQLKRELYLAKRRLDAYLIYLTKFKKNLNYYRNNINKLNVDEIPQPFSFKLPDDFFYIGKLIFLKKSELYKHSILIENKIELSYDIYDLDYADELINNDIIPVLCDGFDRNEFKYTVSIIKGYLMNNLLSMPQLGIDVTVTGLEYNQREEVKALYLQYKMFNNVNFKLSKWKLINPKEIPLIGTKLKIYPLFWRDDLTDYIHVSCHKNDAIINYQFKNLPLIIDSESWKEFSQLLLKDNKYTASSEWKIAPIFKNENEYSTFKFQLGTDLLFEVEILSYNNGRILKYKGPLNLEQKIQATDIFMTANATLNVTLSNESHLVENELYDNMNFFILKARLEFKQQLELKLSMDGISYFNNWLTILNDVYQEKEKGKEYKVNIVENDSTNSKYLFQKFRLIENNQNYEFKREHHFNDEYFLECGRHNFYDVCFYPSSSNISIKGLNLDDKDILDNHYLKLYKKEFPYPEFKQIEAINKLRSGDLVEPKLQSYLLNGKNIKSENKGEKIGELINKKLLTDEAQYTALIKAYDEKYIFFIQGPPGTGKTTVIRELICQELLHHPKSRILVVSQANVAVDNVLLGLNRFNHITKIRCGSDKKINGDLLNDTLQQKYKNLVDKFKKINITNDNIRLVDKWNSLFEDSNNSDLENIILKSHNVVGATCVGLANRKIGLDRLKFDLVILDEAGKALPGEFLIPLIQASKAVIIGDHMQLPPTTTAEYLDSKNLLIPIEEIDSFNQDIIEYSLFEKLFVECPESNKTMLKTQYRMPALIGSLVSKLFYNNKLQNAKSTMLKTPIFFDSVLNFIDFSEDSNYKESRTDKGVYNKYEVKQIKLLVDKIISKIGNEYSIAIITPYKMQKKYIANTIRGLNHENISVNTIDAYQGDEADIVIYATTRAYKKTKYFSDFRRINVALSRCKRELIIMGSAKYFSMYHKDESVLTSVIAYIKQYGNFMNAKNINDDLR